MSAWRAEFNSPARYLTNEAHIHVQWLATRSLQAEGASPRGLKKYFRVTPHRGLFNAQGIPEHLWIQPTRLEPRDGFHRLATRDFDPTAQGFARTPYGLVVNEDLRGTITTASAGLFPGNVLVTRIGAKFVKPVGHDLDQFIQELQVLRSAKSIPMVSRLIKTMHALATGASLKVDLHTGFQSYFSIEVRLPHDRKDFEKTVSAHRRQFVSLLIGTENAETLRDELIERVFKASEELNTKAVDELLLLNKQGFLYVLPDGKYRGPHLHRFERTRDLATLACYARGFLRDGVRFAKAEPKVASDLLRILRYWIEYPELTLDVSKTQTISWVALIQAKMLNERFSPWDEIANAH